MLIECDFGLLQCFALIQHLASKDLKEFCKQQATQPYKLGIMPNSYTMAQRN